MGFSILFSIKTRVVLSALTDKSDIEEVKVAE